MNNYLEKKVYGALKKYYGFNEFRPLQKDIILNICQGNDTIALLPTGGGKSLCFQIPALVLPGLTLVISPLISLMTDQVDALKKRAVSAACLTSQANKEENQTILQNVQQGNIKILYVAPERLAQPTFQDLLQKITISLVVLDEAHCLSQWGHEFRPSYVQIVQHLEWLKNKKSNTVWAAFTATATLKVLDELQSILNLHKPTLFRASFARDNLQVIVHQVQGREEKELALCHFVAERLKEHSQSSGIIYAATKKSTEYVSQLINYYLAKDQSEPLCYPYHAGLASPVRQETQTHFIENRIQIISATNAFGMGVDKSNVRWVVHYQLPGSLEAYYQEIGRAGRDRNVSTCLLLADPNDVLIQKHFIQGTQNETQKTHEEHLLKTIIEYVISTQCRTRTVLQYFGESDVEPTCKCCDCCIPAFTEFVKINQTDWATTIITSLMHLSKSTGIPANFILNSIQKQWISVLEPKSSADFMKIPGIGPGWIDTWYNRLLKKQVLATIH